MSSAAIATAIKMLQALPEPTQERIVEHLREYIEDLNDELRWEAAFGKTHKQLIAAARRAKEEISKRRGDPR